MYGVDRKYLTFHCLLQDFVLTHAYTVTFLLQAIYPFDTVRSRILSLPRPLEDPTITARKIAVQIYKLEGVQGFYKGILPCLLRAAPVAACVLPTYDFVLDYFVSIRHGRS